MGAYLQLLTPGIAAARPRTCSPAIYKFETHYASLHRRVHHQDARPTPTAAPAGRRRPSRSSGCVDDLAAELGIDPIELRRRNWIAHEEFPYTTVAGLDLRLRQLRGRHRPGAGAVRLRRAARRAGRRRRVAATRCSWASASRRTPRCAGSRRPAGWARWGTSPAAGSAATVRMLPTGKVEVVTGTSPHGQGHVTACSQIAADALGVPVRGRRGHRQRHRRRRRRGMDTYGSRSLVVGGIADPPRRRGRGGEGAGCSPRTCWRPAPDDLEFDAGTFRVKGTPDRPRKTIQEVAFASFTAHDLPDGTDATLYGRPPGRPGDLLLPARHPPVRGRGRHRDRA